MRCLSMNSVTCQHRLVSSTRSASVLLRPATQSVHRASSRNGLRRTPAASSFSRQYTVKCYQVLDISTPPGQPNNNLPNGLQQPIDTAAIAVPQPEEKPSFVPPFLLSIFQWYAGCLETNPVLTKSLTALLGFCLGDMLAQSIEGTHTQLDVYRCLRLGTYGLFLDGPVQHFWYRFLDRSVWPEDSTSMKAVITKTAADQLLWSPLMTCVFFTWLKLLEGHPDMILATIHAKVLPTLAANYLFWPLVHMFNFRYIPTEWRVLYNQVMCIAWIGFLSVLTHHGIRVSDFSF